MMCSALFISASNKAAIEISKDFIKLEAKSVFRYLKHRQQQRSNPKYHLPHFQFSCNHSSLHTDCSPRELSKGVENQELLISLVTANIY